MIAPGDAAGFSELHAALHQLYQPRNAIEVILVERIVACSWRLRRVIAMQAAIFGDDDPRVYKLWRVGEEEQRFTILTRFETALERSLHRTIKALDESKAKNYEKNPSPVLADIFIPEGIDIPELEPLEEAEEEEEEGEEQELPNEPNDPDATEGEATPPEPEGEQDEATQSRIRIEEGFRIASAAMRAAYEKRRADGTI